MMAASSMEVETGPDGKARCWWCLGAPEYIDYHDRVWGRPMRDDRELFEMLVLESFQSGLSWLTILRKRDNFRAAFAGFDPELVCEFDDSDVERLLADSGIVRHAGKIRSTINNAHRALELAQEFGSLAAYFWPHAEFGAPPTTIPATTHASTALSKDLKRRGWSFVGPTTIYAFMQAMGLVNDHLDGCHVRQRAEAARSVVYRRVVGSGGN
ncbi:MAG TPA: DNA-3-methyladenine glycosylase I [Solirubrobacterales bacterium]|nr:DNA-3-methyladenine glycosylase I [Solirubrobacterales bacterium]